MQYQRVFGRGEGTSRIEAFSDGVFAIVITLLVLSLQVPDLPPNAPPLDIPQFLADEAPKLRAYVLSFAVIGLFWVNHHRIFAQIERYDSVLMWLNLLLLLFVSFIPFPTTLLGRHEGPDAVRLYAANLALAGATQVAVWAYAALGHRLVAPHINPRLATYVTLRGLVGPVLFAASFLVSYWDAMVAMLMWALIPVGFLVVARLYGQQAMEDDQATLGGPAAHPVQ